MTTTTAKPKISTELLARACRRADVDALVGAITIDNIGRPMLAIMFRTHAYRADFFRALRDLDADAATALPLGSFAGQVTGAQTILHADYAAFAERRCMLLYCPHVDADFGDGVKAVLLTAEGLIYTDTSVTPWKANGWPTSRLAPSPRVIEEPKPIVCPAGLVPRVTQILDDMRDRIKHRAPGCHNVYADLWQAAGVEFGDSPNPRVRERGVQVLPGLHDDRAAFLAGSPALSVAYAALEVAAAEHVVSRRLEDEIGEDSSVLEALFADYDADELEQLADRGALIGVIDHAKAMVLA